MKKLFALPVAGLMLLAASPAAETATPLEGPAAAIAAILAAAPIPSCVDLDPCGEGHAITASGLLDYYQDTHECWPGIIHSGPKCNESLLPLDELLQSSPEEILEHVAYNPKVLANLSLGRIETLNCAGDLLAVADFHTLGITVEMLTAD